MTALQVWSVGMDLQGLEKLPWWWTAIKGLSNRIENIQQMAAWSADGKTVPPQDIWLKNDELEQWHTNQQALKAMEDLKK